jgi:hypothetical protein
VVDTLVAAELIEEQAVAAAAAAVEQANAQVEEVRAAQMEGGEGALAAAPADG